MQCSVRNGISVGVTAFLIACSGSSEEEPSISLSLEPYVGRLVVLPVVLDGDTLSFLFDTGAGETLITPAVAERIGCIPRGRTLGFRMSGEPVEFAYCADVILDFAGRSWSHDQIGVWDIGAILPADWPPLGGVLSLRTFLNQPITLDLENRLLTLENRLSLAQKTAGMTRLEARVATGTDGSSVTLFVRGQIGPEGWFLLDSGNLDAVIIGPHMISVGAAVPNPGEVFEGRVQLNGLPSVTTSLRVRDIIYDGALSEEFLRLWILTVDLRSGEVWAQAASSREAA